MTFMVMPGLALGVFGAAVTVMAVPGSALGVLGAAVIVVAMPGSALWKLWAAATYMVMPGCGFTAILALILNRGSSLIGYPHVGVEVGVRGRPFSRR